jgi:hypothetical protein
MDKGYANFLNSTLNSALRQSATECYYADIKDRDFLHKLMHILIVGIAAND